MLFSPSREPEPQVLIVLESLQTSMRIQALLSRYGVSATPVSLAALDEDRPCTGFRLVVTYTAMIGRVRSALDLPVVNVETQNATR